MARLAIKTPGSLQSYDSIRDDERADCICLNRSKKPNGAKWRRESTSKPLCVLAGAEPAAFAVHLQNVDIMGEAPVSRSEPNPGAMQFWRLSIHSPRVSLRTSEAVGNPNWSTRYVLAFGNLAPWHLGTTRLNCASTLREPSIDGPLDP
jgi:hypothetical protein